MNLNFAHPQMLWLLLLLPLLMFALSRPGRTATVRFPSVMLVKQVARSHRRRAGSIGLLLRLLPLTLVILALARPQTGEEIRTIEASGIDIMMAVDLSTSMWAHDFELNGKPVDRLTPLKQVMRDFIAARPSDRIGLIAFAADPWLVSPLTLNHDWLNQRIGGLRIGMVEDGTAIGSAIATAAARLNDSDGDSRILILLTDGANNRGWIDPIPAAQMAAQLGIKIYGIGVGQLGMVPFPAQFDQDGQPARNRLGQLMLRRWESDMDLQTLEQVASLTGGISFHAEDTEALARIYREIDQLERTEVKMQVRQLYSDWFWVPLLGALLLLLLERLLPFTRFHSLPS